jgi:hypothetical protein
MRGGGARIPEIEQHFLARRVSSAQDQLLHDTVIRAPEHSEVFSEVGQRTTRHC